MVSSEQPTETECWIRGSESCFQQKIALILPTCTPSGYFTIVYTNYCKILILDKNCICFDENDNLKFIQPLIFDLESTETEITVTKRNGLGTVEYSIDGTNWQETTVFSALDSNTQYTILGKTTDNKMVSEYSIFTKAVVENV